MHVELVVQHNYNWNSTNTKVSYIKLDIKHSRWTTEATINLNYIFEKPCGRSSCLALALEPYDHMRKSILVAANINQSSTTRIILEENWRNLIATKKKIQWVSLEQYDFTHHSSNTILASKLSVLFALGIQDRYGFQILIIANRYRSGRITYLMDLVFNVGGNVMVCKYITFCDEKYLLYYWCSGLCRESGPADDYLLAFLCI